MSITSTITRACTQFGKRERERERERERSVKNSGYVGHTQLERKWGHILLGCAHTRFEEACHPEYPAIKKLISGRVYARYTIGVCTLFTGSRPAFSHLARVLRVPVLLLAHADIRRAINNVESHTSIFASRFSTGSPF